MHVADGDPVSIAMKARKRAVSRAPPWPMTRSRGKPEALRATWHIASMGLLKMMMTALGDAFAAASTFARTSLRCP